jgi:hypothetical protein
MVTAMFEIEEARYPIRLESIYLLKPPPAGRPRSVMLDLPNFT